MTKQIEEVGFVLTGMTSLRYFIPIIRKLRSRNIKSIFFMDDKCNGKYNSIIKNRVILDKLLKSFEISARNINELATFSGIVFQIEGDGFYKNQDKQFNISITYMTDFVHVYDSYVNKVNHVIFPSKSFANNYQKISSKNLYLGSPKYDITNVPNRAILEKYNLVDNDNIVLIIAPRSRDISKANLKSILENLKANKYTTILKSRGKEKIFNNYTCDLLVEDGEWYPHPTCELLQVANIVINFSSTVIKECVLYKKPIINFHVKPFAKHLSFLYDYNFCKNLQPNISDISLIEEIEDLIVKNTNDLLDFDLAIKEHLFEVTKTTDKIIDNVFDLYLKN